MPPVLQALTQRCMHSSARKVLLKGPAGDEETSNRLRFRKHCEQFTNHLDNFLSYIWLEFLAVPNETELVIYTRYLEHSL